MIPLQFPQSVIFVLILTVFYSLPVFAQNDPLEYLTIDRTDTRNFEITMERSDHYRRPTPKEVGVLVERLCSQLDKIFLKYAPHRIADEPEQANTLVKKTPVTKKREVDYEDPNRVIPKCRIFIFNERSAYVSKCLFDGLEALDEGYAGFFTTKTNSVYMIRSNSLQQTRQTILHETTHYYMYNFLPGGWRCYPEWFHEGMATSYEKHTWNGDKLVIGVAPRIQIFDAPAAALGDLIRFRTFIKNQTGQKNTETEDTETVSKKGTAKPETPIDPALIQPFLNTKFKPEQFMKEGIILPNPQEALAHQYAVYEAFGRFLLFARPDLLNSILRQIALWEKDKDKTYPKTEWFTMAWKKVAEDNMVTVEEIGRWLQKNQLPFKWSFGDWQDQGDQIAGKAEEGRISILAMSQPQTMPRFSVSPKNSSRFQTGMVINFVDKENFGVVAVDQDGDVLYMEKQHGDWTGAKKFGKINSIQNRNSPYPGSPVFQFAAAQQGNMIAVRINNTLAGTWQKNSKGCCGFFISHTEAMFSY